jgi:hypothetical protein
MSPSVRMQQVRAPEDVGGVGHVDHGIEVQVLRRALPHVLGDADDCQPLGGRRLLAGRSQIAQADALADRSRPGRKVAANRSFTTAAPRPGSPSPRTKSRPGAARAAMVSK